MFESLYPSTLCPTSFLRPLPANDRLMSRKGPGVQVQPPPFAPKPAPEEDPEDGRSFLSEGWTSALDRRLYELLTQARAHDRLFPASLHAEGPPTTVVVAVSGGADSVTLLHLLTRLRADWSLHLVAAHLDHGLRPESAGDADFIAGLATRWGLRLETSTLPPAALARQGNLEAAARRARYRFLADVAVSHQIDGNPVEVAVAHTANDQAETVLMNLIRGSGLDGLAGMRPARPLVVNDRPVPGVQLVRPLLGVSRSEILQYLSQHNISWREDPTNQDRRLVRNRMRHEILPRLQEINPQIIASLCRTASLLAAEAQRADSRTRKATRTTRRGDGYASGRKEQANNAPSSKNAPSTRSSRQVFDLPAFRALGVADQRATLRAAGRCLGLARAHLGFDTIERLRRTLLDEDRAGGPYNWVAELMLTRTHDTFSLHRQGAPPIFADHPYLDDTWRTRIDVTELPVPGAIEVDGWTLRGEPLTRADLPHGWQSRLSRWEAYIDADRVQRLTLSAPRSGQRFAPLGLRGHGKPLAAYFTDRKVPRPLRRGWPLLLDGAEIVWVGGHQIADSVRITDRSRRILHLHWEETSQ